MKILITGEPLIFNKGCMGMVMGLYDGLKEKGLEFDIDLLSSKFYLDDKKMYEEYPNLSVVMFPWTSSKDVSKGTYSKPSYLKESTQLLLEFGGMIPKKVKEFFLKYDLIIDINGDSLTEDYGLLPLIRRLLPLNLGSRLGIRTIVMAQTIGPFHTNLGKWLIKRALDRQSVISARENFTYNYLHEIGIETEIQNLADLAFLQNPEIAKVDEDLEKILLSSKTKTLAVSISNLMKKWGDQISGNEGVDFLDCFEKLLEKIILENDYNIVLIPHVIRPDQDDRETAAIIFERLSKYSDKVYFLKENYHSKRLKWIIGKCDILISSRMHAAIAGLSQGVPTICISKGVKFKSLVGERLNQSDYVLDITESNFEQITNMAYEKFEHIDSQRNAVSENITKHSNIQRELAKENIELVSRKMGA
ncbi:polysaccharide pyruvyl transferase family protein [Fusibacter sp. JL216-2]|uniref:polysaccharide pyruvyl transferase family protein n=1 Tax=Fusibacter sp. JL216-2 TaxID=3071453 RepID=UPI003D33E268